MTKRYQQHPKKSNKKYLLNNYYKGGYYYPPYHIMIIVLYTPQIPQNTGNIVRICKVTNSKLVLIKPLGFEVTERRCKRAGLDYWDDICLSIEEDFFFFS